MTGRMENKVVFVTGAARGQGRSHAVRLAEEGADIIAVDICEQIETNTYPMATPEDLEMTVKEVEALDRRIVARKADVRDRRQLATVIDEAVAELGRLDVVVANAGICPTGNQDIQAFFDTIDVDFMGVQNAIVASMKHLQDGASIIITSSTAAMMPNTMTTPEAGAGGAGYGLAKQMLVRYTEILALKLAPRAHPGQRHPADQREHAPAPPAVDLQRLPARPRTAGLARGRRGGLRRLPGDADPVHRADRHQQHGAVLRQRRDPLRHRLDPPRRCRVDAPGQPHLSLTR